MSVGGGRGSFRRLNPQLAQCVESLHLVCNGLTNAPAEWWKQHRSAIENPPFEPTTAGAEDYESGSDDEIGEAIDLQAKLSLA